MALGTFRGEGFAITPDVLSGTLTARLEGTGDTGAVSPFEDFLARAETEVSESRVRAVAFDMRQLYLLNSRMLKALAAFVVKVVSNPGLGRVRFLVDPNLGWQRRSLLAIMRLAPQLVVIDDA